MTQHAWSLGPRLTHQRSGLLSSDCTYFWPRFAPSRPERSGKADPLAGALGREERRMEGGVARGREAITWLAACTGRGALSAFWKDDEEVAQAEVGAEAMTWWLAAAVAAADVAGGREAGTVKGRARTRGADCGRKAGRGSRAAEREREREAKAGTTAGDGGVWQDSAAAHGRGVDAGAGTGAASAEAQVATPPPAAAAEAAPTAVPRGRLPSMPTESDAATLQSVMRERSANSSADVAGDSAAPAAAAFLAAAISCREGGKNGTCCCMTAAMAEVTSVAS